MIKPSGVPCEDLETGHLVVVGPDGRAVEGNLRPSSDTETHLVIGAWGQR
ncbi:MAG: class II aldolase/adducin family protein [Bacillota bacterium]